MEKYTVLNQRLKENLTRGVFLRSRELFPKKMVMSSSFGRYSAAILHMAVSIIPKIPIIHLKLDHETEATKRHRKELKDRLNLNLKVFDAGEDKSSSLKKAIKTLHTSALISGVLWVETDNREDFEYFMQDKTFGITRVYPLLHWKEADLFRYIQIHDLPINDGHVDHFKEASEKKECGIHLFQNGGGI